MLGEEMGFQVHLGAGVSEGAQGGVEVWLLCPGILLAASGPWVLGLPGTCTHPEPALQTGGGTRLPPVLQGSRAGALNVQLLPRLWCAAL